jgi:hypothetical protein
MYSGVGRMNTVIGRLKDEGDRVPEGLFSTWEEKRRVHRRVRKRFFLLLALRSRTDLESLHLQLSSIKATSSISLPSLASVHLPSLPIAASSLLNTYDASRRAGAQTSTNAPTPAAASEEYNGPNL